MEQQHHTIVQLLEDCVQMQDQDRFVDLVRNTDWSLHAPEEIFRAIDMTLMDMQLKRLAMELAQQAGRLFPENKRAQYVAHVLSPPVARVVKDAPKPRGMRETMAWFDKHAKEYRGLWVAVREGSLLGASKDLKELKPLIGDGEDAVSTLVTRVL